MAQFLGWWHHMDMTTGSRFTRKIVVPPPLTASTDLAHDNRLCCEGRKEPSRRHNDRERETRPQWRSNCWRAARGGAVL